MLAKEVASVAEIDTSGRRGGMKLMIAKVLDTIGFAGVIEIGVVALAATLFWGYQRMKSPPMLTTIERPALSRKAVPLRELPEPSKDERQWLTSEEQPEGILPSSI
jgi:hypothetical protein